MQKYEQNRNQINGVLIKNSDMDYELKNLITGLLREAQGLGLGGNDKISEYITVNLEKSHPGAWVCVVGKKFAVNIMHQPGYFLRVSTQDFHYVIFKLKAYNKTNKTSKVKRLNSIGQ